MFGIGRKIKRLSRNAQYFYNDKFVNSETSVNFFRNLEEEYYAPEYFIDITINNKIIYVQIPKSGTSTIKLILSRSVGYYPANETEIHKRKTSGLLSPRMVGLDRFFSLVHDPETLIFTVTRHPLDRLLSCYKDKFLPYAISAPTPYNKDALKILNSIESPYFDPTKPLPFDAFVRMCCHSCYARINGHWSAMSDIVPLNQISFSHIGRLENIETTFDILRRQGLPESVFPETAMNKSKQSNNLPNLDPELADMINRAYAADFSNFGYDLIQVGN